MKHIACCAMMIAVAGVALSSGAQSSQGFIEGAMAPLVNLKTGASIDKTAANTTAVVASPGVVCPVILRALQGAGYGLVHVRGEEPANAPGQRVHLIVLNGKRGTARSARVLVTGLSPKSRMKNASNMEERPDARRTMAVTFDPEDATSVAAELVLPGFTSVSSVELQSITYQDGNTWSVAKGEACRVTPDPLMLVAAH